MMFRRPMKKVHAVLFAFLMMTMSLAGCLSGDAGEDGEDGKDGAEGVAGPAGEDGSSLHMVSSSADLPNCDSTHLGQIYFVSEEGAFQVCSTNGWAVVDLTGPEGPAGSDGIDGVDGADGSASINTMLTSISEPNSEDCSLGGRVVSEGLDNGDMDLTTYADNFTVGDAGLNLTIPDNNETGLNSTIDLTNMDGLVDQIEIFVNISHNWIGDLVIRLTTPNGDELVLRENTGGASNDIVEWIGSEQLSSLKGQDIVGEWVLNIEDEAGGDAGVLNSWLIRHTNTTVMSYPANGVLEVEEVDYLTTYCSKYVAEMIIDVNYGTANVVNMEFIGTVDIWGDVESPIVYFRGGSDTGLMGYNPLNGSAWETNSTIVDVENLVQIDTDHVYYTGRVGDYWDG